MSGICKGNIPLSICPLSPRTHPQSTTIVAVHEDWPGGAGNGLGTLYAFQKAVAKVGLSKHEVDAVMD